MKKNIRLIIVTMMLMLIVGCDKKSEKKNDAEDLSGKASTENSTEVKDEISEEMDKNEIVFNENNDDICIKNATGVTIFVDGEIDKEAVHEEVYDFGGNLIGDWMTFDDGYIIGQKYEYTENGSMIVDSFKGKECMDHVTYQFDAYGNIINAEHIYETPGDIDNNIPSSEVIINTSYELEYDKNNNVISRAIKIGNDNPNIYHYEYDEFGNVVKESDIDGNIIHEYQWNEMGNLVCSKCFSHEDITHFVPHNLEQITSSYYGLSYDICFAPRLCSMRGYSVNYKYGYEDGKISKIDSIGNYQDQEKNIQYVYDYTYKDVYVDQSCENESGVRTADEAVDIFNSSYLMNNLDLARCISLQYYLLYERKGRTFNQDWEWKEYFDCYGDVNYINGEFELISLDVDDIMKLEGWIEERTDNKVTIKESFIYCNSNDRIDNLHGEMFVINIEDRWYVGEIN